MPSSFEVETKLQISLQIIISATGQKELQSYFSSVFFNLDFYYFLTLANVKEVAIADITNSFPRN
jgi:hypothetical protein